LTPLAVQAEPSLEIDLIQKAEIKIIEAVL
jgi:hypothetical protein